MTFQEKLKRLTEDYHRSRLSLRAGLPPNAISDYVNKGHLPSASIALRIAKVLNVSVEWLIDDTRDWPPLRTDSPGSRDPGPRPVAA
ncbi:MAG TPA: helix-turn-helix transcriptional regulator [Tepidisphaeraceae bacterium]|jgi:transcriptional regulator with XRE-family HTH domain|nr:helix-turn-helix transcriptional regulator [Tepidisphaeraceae bacterium]